MVKYSVMVMSYASAWVMSCCLSGVGILMVRVDCSPTGGLGGRPCRFLIGFPLPYCRFQ